MIATIGADRTGDHLALDFYGMTLAVVNVKSLTN